MPNRPLNFLFFLAIFVSSFLLFQVQPLITKVLLPIFGGVPAVWTTSLVFFQTALFLGYLYAYCSISYVKPQFQPLLHLSLLLLSFIALPFSLSANLGSFSGDPTWELLRLLASIIFVPYFLLAASNTLFGNWFSRQNPDGSAYKLYGISNLSSLAALLSYPLVFEPDFGLGTQMTVWTAAYYGFVLLVTALTAQLGFSKNVRSNVVASLDAEQVSQFPILWVLQSACGTVLLMGITTFITTELAPMPLLWVLPLSVYLLTFILAFLTPRFYSRRLYGYLVLVALAIGAFGLSPAFSFASTVTGPKVLVVGSLIILFLTCAICHGELAFCKPSSSGMGKFYLFISLGGMLGGIFAGIFAPLIFVHYVELPLALLLCLALRTTGVPKMYLTMLGVFAALLIIGDRQVPGELAASRNFFGTLVVKQLSSENNDSQLLGLVHGKTIHGLQFISPEKSQLPIGYYGPQSGIGLVLNRQRSNAPRRIGAIGLGVGSVAAYGKDGDYIRFYEINPAVIHFAQSYFSFLKNSAAKVEVILGDARLKLQAEPPQKFDVLLVDAFNGDSLPFHLLTKEAFDIYEKHLAPDGALVFHISNRYVDLRRPILRNLADRGLQTAVLAQQDNPEQQWRSNTYVVAGHHLQGFELSDLSVSESDKQWTDDYSTILPYFYR